MMLERQLDSYDGTRLSYQLGGAGQRWILFANGYGGSFWAWQEVFEQLAPRYRLLVWDYRGFHGSGLPPGGGPIRIEDHCRDLECLMAAEQISSAVLVGWSVGVQVVLEHYRRRPETVEALALVNGAQGRVLSRSMDGRLAALLLPPLLRGLQRLVPAANLALLPLLRQLARSPLSVAALARLGLVSGQPASIHVALQSVLTLDYARYIELGFGAEQHDADDVLESIRVPTLVTAGDRDILTRPRLARAVAARIPGARYFEIPGGTHYAMMEFPRLVANRLDSFIRGALDHPPPTDAGAAR